MYYLKAVRRLTPIESKSSLTSWMISPLRANVFPREAACFYIPNWEVSSVKLFVTLNSFQITTLAVLYLVFSWENLHILKSKIGSTEAMIFGKRRVLVQESRPSFGALLQPYMNVFWFLLCPCRSQNIVIPADYWAVAFMFILRKYNSGWMVAFGLHHLLFKSTPARDDLEFPRTTPSGLTIGTSLMIFRLRMLSYFSKLVENSFIILLMIREPWVSAACSLAWM